jgi:hypothetical protein
MPTNTGHKAVRINSTSFLKHNMVLETPDLGLNPACATYQPAFLPNPYMPQFFTCKAQKATTPASQGCYEVSDCKILGRVIGT